MENKEQMGKTMDYAASGADVASGDVVAVGNRVAVAIADIKDGESGAVDLHGVYRLNKVAAVGWSQGDVLYWNESAKELTNVGAGNKRAGIAFTTAQSADATALVLLGENLGKAAAIPVLGTTTDLVGVDGTGSNAAPLAGTETRLDAVEGKVDTIIATLQALGLTA